MKHVVVAKDNHIAGVLRINTGLRRGLESAHAKVRLADVAQRAFTLARESDLVFDVVRRMSRRAAVMAVVTKTSLRGRPSQIVGSSPKNTSPIRFPTASSRLPDRDPDDAWRSGTCDTAGVVAL
jgi:hypothetical protein